MMLVKKSHWFLLFILVGILLVTTTVIVRAAPVSQSASNGETLFKTKCTACHTIGGGKLVGPDLKGITTQRDVAWLTSWIKAPDKVLAAGDPVATKLLAENNNLPMPNLGLSDTEVADLIAYFKSMDGTTSAQAVSAPATGEVASGTQAADQSLNDMTLVLMMKGNADYGQKLFTGEIPLANGGTPCIACHTVRGVGLLGGGGLGPDQTHVYSRLGGEKGLAGVLSTLPFPTMQGIFANRQLTVDEQADLRAFFRRADQQGAPQTQLDFQFIVGVSAGIMLILLVGMSFFWPRQRLSLSQRLRKFGKL